MGTCHGCNVRVLRADIHMAGLQRVQDDNFIATTIDNGRHKIIDGFRSSAWDFLLNLFVYDC